MIKVQRRRIPTRTWFEFTSSGTIKHSTAKHIERPLLFIHFCKSRIEQFEFEVYAKQVQMLPFPFPVHESRSKTVKESTQRYASVHESPSKPVEEPT